VFSLQGHWASECPKGHEPEWIAKQQCSSCNKVGHIKSDCPNKGKKKQFITNKSPIAKKGMVLSGFNYS
jgi:hypothetical protein